VPFIDKVTTFKWKKSNKISSHKKELAYKKNQVIKISFIR